MPKTNNKATIIKQNVGIDVSKDDLKVCFSQLDATGRCFVKGSRTFKNTLSGFCALQQWVEKKRVANLEVRISLEATGVYHESLVYYLHEQNYRVSVILANQSNAYAKSLNLKTKTDKVDARMLSQMGIERELSVWKPMSTNMRLIKQLTRDRASLLTEKTALTNRLHALEYSFKPCQNVLKRLRQRIAFIQKQLKQVDREINQAVSQDEHLNEKVQRISQVKGLAMISIVTILAETNGFALFTSRAQLTSYAGYDVVHKQSGSSINGKTRISKKGNKHIRRALYFPAISAVQREPQFKQLFERVLQRSGIKMKGYVAVQRKLLILIYTLYKNDIVYDPNYLTNQSQIPNLKQAA